MPPKPTWRCAICKCTAAQANRRRLRQGLTRLQAAQKVCSAACRWELRLRQDQQVFAARVNGKLVRSAAWRCAGCGCTAEEDARRRARDGRMLTDPNTKTCSRACYALTRIGRVGGRRG